MAIDRRYLRRLLIVAGCLFADPTPTLVFASLPFFLAGGALHLWSKGCLEQNRRLTTAGPYRFTRNPFYLANALVDGATCLVIGQLWIGAVFALLFFATYRETIGREERTLEGLFPESFPDYRARVPCLLPTGRSLAPENASGTFAWSNPGLAQGQEYARLLGITLGPLAIVGASVVRTEGAALLTPAGAPALAGLVALPALWIVKLALADVFRRPGQALVPPAKSQGARLGLAGVCAALAIAAAAWKPWLAVWPGLWGARAARRVSGASRRAGRAGAGIDRIRRVALCAKRRARQYVAGRRHLDGDGRRSLVRGMKETVPSTAMRVSCLSLAGVFALSAAVQWNDPDPGIWITVYLVGAAISAAAGFGRFWPRPTGLFGAVVALWFASLAPSLPGAPGEAFTSFEMQAASHETPREAVGLAILASWMVFLAVRGRALPESRDSDRPATGRAE